MPVVRKFAAHIKERALGAEVSEALNPSQQIVKIVNEELITILGGQTRRINMAKTGPTIIMLAGLQGLVKLRWRVNSRSGSRGRGIPPSWWHLTCSAQTR